MSDIHRHFWKCMACLEPMVSEGKGADVLPLDCNCPFCGTNKTSIVYMGRVSGLSVSLVKDHLLCACDGRCTGAIGPSCDCSCRGVNHGTGAVVVHTTDEGGVPACRKVTPEAQSAAASRVEEFKKSRTQLTEKISIKCHGNSWKARGFEEKVYKAAKLKIHKNRMARLDEISKQVDFWVTENFKS